MKKFFLIPLMTLVCSVMAFATVRTAGTYQELQNALSAAVDGDEIQLTADIAYPKNGTGLINITKSITLDGQGHKVSGYGDNGGRPNVIAINNGNTSYVTVELKNLDIYSTQYRPLETRGYITKLTLDNVNITSTGGSSNPQGLTIGGTQTSEPYGQLVVKDSKISATASGYPVIFWNPTEVTLTNSDFSGYCALYFKEDSYGSSVYADACNFDAPNVHSGASNAFAVFALETTNLTFHLNNCGMNAEKYGDQSQDVFSLSEWTPLSRRNGDITILLSGDNSHFSTSSMFIGNTYYYAQVGGTWTLITNDNKDEFNFGGNLNVTFTGGTYSVNPYEMAYYRTFYWDEESLEADLGGVTILPTDTVQEINQGGVTLYRVVKKAQEKAPGVLYNLNDDVPTDVAGEGINPATSFELSTGGTMELAEDREVTKAGYVQVKDNEDTGNATVVKVGTTETADPTQKVDQTLIINNGLDVQGDSKVEVQAGSALVIGEGGINTQKPENIIIEADENGAASLLLEPSITINQNPELTVKMTVPAEHAGYQMNDAVQYRHWFRFAVPVKDATTWTKTPNVPTYLYGWDYAGQQWAQVSVAEMDPFYGYTLSPDQEIDDSTSVTYTFKGKLLGNEDCKLELNHHGYNFFGNSYTGYISVLKLVDQIIEDSKIDGTVWMWDGEKYEGVALSYLKQYGNVPGLVENWKKEVAPMQTFVLRLTGSEFSSTDINYADAIWGNPRYTSAVASAAPARNIELNDNAVIRMTVSANNHKQSVTFIENNDFSDEYNRGYDAIKYMNENSINMYVNVNGENYGTIATDNIEGKTLNLRTTDAYTYTLTFDFAAGEEYALHDNVTGAVIAIENGVTYEFAAQPNSTIEGRFEIVAAAKMPTAIENTEVKANVKGIYTIMGQYLGEDFDILPAGVYVVDGVKIVK